MTQVIAICVVLNVKSNLIVPDMETSCLALSQLQPKSTGRYVSSVLHESWVEQVFTLQGIQ